MLDVRRRPIPYSITVTCWGVPGTCDLHLVAFQYLTACRRCFVAYRVLYIDTCIRLVAYLMCVSGIPTSCIGADRMLIAFEDLWASVEPNYNVVSSNAFACR